MLLLFFQAPPNSFGAFFNYKKTFSIHLLAVANSTYEFIYVDVGASGRQGDAGVFARSSFGQALNGSQLNLPANSVLPGTNDLFPYIFVADNAFPIGQNLLKPFSGTNLSLKKRIFDYRLSRARRCIEQTFGILVQTWQILKKPMCVEPDKADVIVMATVVLHNYLSKNGETLGVRENVGDNTIRGDAGNNNRRNHRTGVHLRDRLMSYFMSDAGSIPFQEDVARRGE